MDEEYRDEEYCMLHICRDEIEEQINELVRIYHNDGNGYLKYWIGDESHFDDIYLEKIEEYSLIVLTDEMITMIKKKGRNLEKIIERWLYAEPITNIVPIQSRIQEYIATQFNKEELKDLFDECTCY
jgi:tyrosine-protein phosphatase YwqE